MAIPELDLKKVNLQAAVGYLISLHDNEVDWNLLGIKVVGTQESLPIPAGDYKYGDAYMIGNETDGYIMYIWTRADGGVHKEDYWFPIGQFPKPGPQGPKGDGIGTLTSIDTGSSMYATYDITDGINATYDAIISYKDSTTGEQKSQTVSLYANTPILPGKYISIGNQDSRNVEVKVDDTALALDYYKIDKSQTTSTIPYWDGTKAGTLKASSDNVENSVVQRNANGDCTFHKLNFEIIGSKNGIDAIDYYSIYFNTVGSDLNVNKTTTDTGTLTPYQLSVLKNARQSNNVRIVYDKKIYYRMYPIDDPNGTHNYIHIDSIQNEQGGYKAIGKCFIVNFSTGEWQVVYLDFGGSTSTTDIYRHGIVMYGSTFNIYIDIYDSNSATYTYSALKTKLATEPSYTAVAHISVEGETHISAALVHYNTSLDNYTIMYHNKQNQTTQVNWTPTQVVDNGTPIYNA